MLYGNQEAKTLLQNYIQQYTDSSQKRAWFILLSWPKNIGKSSIAWEMISLLLGPYVQSNLLHIKDYSEELGKLHAIKVEEKDGTEEYKGLLSDFKYKDIGVREINVWMQQSWFWAIKVILIENIERMTIAAANAFLKTCEEPLANRIIIATTGNKSKVIDTILSRAILVPFSELTQQDMTSIANEHMLFSDDPVVQELIITMAMGRPWAMFSFNKILTEDDDLKNNMHQLSSILLNPWNILKKQQLLMKFVEKGIIEQFLDGWIAYTTNHNLIEQSQKRLNIKKMLQTNVQVENIILYGLLD